MIHFATPIAPARVIRGATRRMIGAQIEALIELLDTLDGDPEAEDGDSDCCMAHDDDVSGEYQTWWDGWPGDVDDAEDDGRRSGDLKAAARRWRDQCDPPIGFVVGSMQNLKLLTAQNL